MIDKQYIVYQKHPILPLTIYNYSKTAQFDKVWNEVTLSCRGLVLDDEMNVVAIPFKKFFNYEEHENSNLPLIPVGEEFDAFEKMDGSLGIVFRYKGELIFATRGSFISDQAVKAKEMMKKYDEFKLIDGFTYLFEIIYGNSFLNTVTVTFSDGLKMIYYENEEVKTKNRGMVLAKNLLENDILS